MQTSFNQQIAAIKKAISNEPVNSPMYLALNDAMASISAMKIEEDKKKSNFDTKYPEGHSIPECYD